MDFEAILNKCIKVFSDTDLCDPDCLKRYKKVVSLLNGMRESVRDGSYPRDYSFLPLLHYVDRNMDSSEMYEVVKELDRWYDKNYRQKGPAAMTRETMKTYLLSECGLSEQRADASIAKLAKHKEIYFEFSEYVNKRNFPENGIMVCGYNAKILHQNFPLSPLGAYNYLIYLKEHPQEALADLRAGLPAK